MIDIVLPTLITFLTPIMLA